MTDAFSDYREHLIAVAYRMLGSRSDAEDAVQEAWLRYARSDTSGVADLRAWLTTVTGRICLDVLRSARVQREAYVGPWLPEPIVERLPAGSGFLGAGRGEPADDPAERAALADQVSIALLVVLETLNPEQRVAFVLHDIFSVPFSEVASTLGTSVENARQIASRARRAVTAGERRHTTDLVQQEQVLSAFMDAASGGDIDALLKVLAPDVIAMGDGGGVAPATRVPITGALKVARFLLGLFRMTERYQGTVEPALVNGDLGLLVRFEGTPWPPLGEDPTLVVGFAVSPEGLVTGVYNQLNPEKLRNLPDLG